MWTYQLDADVPASAVR